MHFISKKLLITVFALLYLALQISHAQSVTFNVSGTNPRCESAFPNGAPYTGAVNMPSNAVQIVDVKLQIQRDITGSWGFWGSPLVFTINGPLSFLGYSNNSPGATQLTLTSVNTIRMQATIRWRQVAGGPIITTIVNSGQVAYNYFPAPTTNFNINGAVPPAVPVALNHYLCTGEAFMEPNGNVSGTGVQWRLLLFSSSASGNQGTPRDINTCSWRNGFPPGSINVTSPEDIPAYAGCAIQPKIYTEGEYVLARLEIRNDCGTTSKSVLLRIFNQPSGATVNFFFRGSSLADSHVAFGGTGNTGTGELNPGGPSSNSDGILSWGGTFNSPTWVGASQTVLDCSGTNFFQGIQSWQVTIAVQNGNQFLDIGTYTEIPSNNQISIQSVPISLGGAPEAAGYFSNNFNTSATGVLGKTFRIELKGIGVCNQSPSKIGYFRIIPNQNWWMPVNGGNPNEEVSVKEVGTENLVVMPNPTNGQLVFEIESNDDSEAAIRVVNTQGQAIQLDRSATIPLVKGYNSFTQDITQLPSGTYYIQVIKPSGVLSTKVVKL